MNPLPLSPIAQHDRLIAAFCDDLASPEFRQTGKTPRADAVVAVSKAMREGRA